MCTITLNNLKKNIDGYVTAAVCNEKVHIATDEGSVVLINEEYLRSLEETLYLQSIPGMKEKIQQGLNTPNEECVELDWRNDLK